MQEPNSPNPSTFDPRVPALEVKLDQISRTITANVSPTKMKSGPYGIRKTSLVEVNPGETYRVPPQLYKDDVFQMKQYVDGERMPMVGTKRPKVQVDYAKGEAGYQKRLLQIGADAIADQARQDYEFAPARVTIPPWVTGFADAL